MSDTPSTREGLAKSTFTIATALTLVFLDQQAPFALLVTWDFKAAGDREALQSTAVTRALPLLAVQACIEKLTSQQRRSYITVDSEMMQDRDVRITCGHSGRMLCELRPFPTL